MMVFSVATASCSKGFRVRAGRPTGQTVPPSNPAPTPQETYWRSEVGNISLGQGSLRDWLEMLDSGVLELFEENNCFKRVDVHLYSGDTLEMVEIYHGSCGIEGGSPVASLVISDGVLKAKVGYSLVTVGTFDSEGKLASFCTESGGDFNNCTWELDDMSHIQDFGILQ